MEACALFSCILKVIKPLVQFLNPCRCMTDGKYQQAVGIALECRRLDKLEEAITKSENIASLLAYTLRLSQTFVTKREFRHAVMF